MIQSDMVKSVIYFSFGLFLGGVAVTQMGYVSFTKASPTGIIAPEHPTTPVAQSITPAPVSPMSLQTATVSEPAPPVYGSAILSRRDDGHYWAEASINHAPIQFMVDTGASMVALTRPDAEKIGLDLQPKDYKSFAQTPNGKVRIAQVNLKEITLGTLRIRDVPAVVIDQDEGTSLLGMTFLNRLREFSFQGNKLMMNE